MVNAATCGGVIVTLMSEPGFSGDARFCTGNRNIVYAFTNFAASRRTCFVQGTVPKVLRRRLHQLTVVPSSFSGPCNGQADVAVSGYLWQDRNLCHFFELQDPINTPCLATVIARCTAYALGVQKHAKAWLRMPYHHRSKSERLEMKTAADWVFYRNT
jgi:hypothetical protein